jgi:hypothetical protein
MKDKVKIQRIFRRALWVCEKCGQEDFEDFNLAGGNIYEHNCSKCGTWSNNFKEYNNIIYYTPEEYDKITEEDVTNAKNVLFNKWVNDLKNQPVYPEPTREQLESEKTELQERINALNSKIAEKIEK